jgi:glycosyltransferase involved in cell wall biosynthesis
MRIGINASWMTPGAAGGHEWYCRNLIDQLAQIDRDNQYILVAAPNNYDTFALPGPNWKMCVYDGGADNSPESYAVAAPPKAESLTRAPRSWLHHLRRVYKARHMPGYWTGRLRDLIASERIDLWFCPFIYALPLETEVPIVACIPDLQHEHHPEFFTARECAQRAMGYQHSCRSATAVIAVSEFTAREIVDLYGVAPERLSAIPLGLDRSFLDGEKDLDRRVSQVLAKHGLDAGYIYYPAAGWPHKNHETLLRGLAAARDRGFSGRLVLTGWPFDLMSRIAPLLQELRLHDRVRHLGYVPRSDVIGVLGGARALVFPSLFEGFGLPVIEAMHIGVPVGCSNLCSLPEVGGDAVAYFDPRSPDEIARVIMTLTGDEDTRTRLRDAGSRRAQKFNYRRTAEATLRVFNRIRSGELASPRLPPFRPLISHGWLREGHSRWYFHCRALKRIDIVIDQPAAMPQLAHQRVSVQLDGKPAGQWDIRDSAQQHVTVAGAAPVRDGFHRLDIIASSTASVNGECLSARVLELVVHDENGRTTSLI